MFRYGSVVFEYIIGHKKMYREKIGFVLYEDFVEKN